MTNSLLDVIKTVIKTLRKEFSSNFSDNQNLAINENLTLWKGRFGFKQFIPTKCKRFGIKLFVLCDSNSGIVLNFLIYTGNAMNYDSEYNDSQLQLPVHQNDTNTCALLLS